MAYTGRSGKRTLLADSQRFVVHQRVREKKIQTLVPESWRAEAIGKRRHFASACFPCSCTALCAQSSAGSYCLYPRKITTMLCLCLSAPLSLSLSLSLPPSFAIYKHMILLSAHCTVFHPRFIPRDVFKQRLPYPGHPVRQIQAQQVSGVSCMKRRVGDSVMDSSMRQMLPVSSK